MKSNCNSCRALGGLYPNCKCKLGYEIDSIISNGVTVSFFPLVPCPKPLTFAKYFTIVQDRENAERDKFRSKK